MLYVHNLSSKKHIALHIPHSKTKIQELSCASGSTVTKESGSKYVDGRYHTPSVRHTLRQSASFACVQPALIDVNFHATSGL